MWLYQNKEIQSIEDLPLNTHGFIYVTTHIPTGKKYLGKKSIYHNVTKKLGKKELAELPVTRGRQKTSIKIEKESDWKTYYGSELFIKQQLKENKHQDFTREIIQFVTTKKQLTYYEMKYQFVYGVIEPETGNHWMNGNILGKFFKKDFE